MPRLFLTCVLVAAWSLCAGCGRDEAAISPARMIAKGWNDYDAALYDDAERLFAGAVRRTVPTDELHLRALYGQATTINLRRPGSAPARARPLYEEVMRLNPGSDWAAWSSLALARMVDLPTVNEAAPLSAVVAAYQPVIDAFPYHRAGEEAFTFQQAARVASYLPEEEQRAADLMDRFVAEHPNSVFRSHVYRLLGHAYEALGEYDKALAALLRHHESYHVDARNPRSDYASVYWTIATLANYRAGDFTTARRFYELMIKEYPTEKRVYTAQLALHRMDEIEAGLRTVPTPTP